MASVGHIFGWKKPQDPVRAEIREALDRHKRASDDLTDLVDQLLRQNDYLRSTGQTPEHTSRR